MQKFSNRFAFLLLTKRVRAGRTFLSAAVDLDVVPGVDLLLTHPKVKIADRSVRSTLIICALHASGSTMKDSKFSFRGS